MDSCHASICSQVTNTYVTGNIPVTANILSQCILDSNSPPGEIINDGSTYIPVITPVLNFFDNTLISPILNLFNISTTTTNKVICTSIVIPIIIGIIVLIIVLIVILIKRHKNNDNNNNDTT